MAETGYGAVPDPEEIRDLPELIEALNQLRMASGNPSFRALARLVGSTLRPPQVLAHTTVSDLFQTRRRRLDVDLLTATLRALGLGESEVARWRRACIRVHVEQKAGAPIGVLGQLPAELATFTGRQKEVRQLIEAAAHGEARGRNVARTPVISAIEGMAGVGKTQLAVRVAHELVRTGRFNDLQLFVNLRGFDPDLPPADPSAVLETFLRQLGVRVQQIPSGRDERAAMYRDQLRRRSALILLDNAADEDQVRDLIPAGPGCLVLITSRRSLAGLDGVIPYPIGVFSAGESLELLKGIAGHDRVASEPEAAARITGYCDHLPLAVALTAARLRSRHTWSLGTVADQLEAGRLDEIRAGRRAIRPVLELSYRALPAAAQRLFRLSGVHPGPDLSAESAAALSGRTVAEAAETLDLLLDESMVQQRSPGRYELHDLLRAYALELAAQDDDDTAAAITRVTSWYAHSVHNAMMTLRKTVDFANPPCEADPAQFSSDEAAMAWVAAEETNLEHAMRSATESGLHQIAWWLSRYLDYLYFESGRITDALRVNRLGADTARKVGDHSGEARSLCSAGWDHMELRLFDEAASCYRRALELAETDRDPHVKALALTGLGKISSDQGRYADALEFHRAALATNIQLGDLRHIGYVHCNIGVAYYEVKHYDLALASYEQSLEILDRPETDSFTLVVLLGNLAEVQLLTGKHDEALRYQTRCLELARTYGFLLQEAISLLALGDIYAALGQTDEAREAWAESAVLYERLGDSRAAEARQRFE